MPPETSKVPERFAPGTFDTVITDLPYASGGRTQAEKNKSFAHRCVFLIDFHHSIF